LQGVQGNNECHHAQRQQCKEHGLDVADGLSAWDDELRGTPSSFKAGDRVKASSGVINRTRGGANKPCPT
jgi:hypothetical protein